MNRLFGFIALVALVAMPGMASALSISGTDLLTATDTYSDTGLEAVYLTDTGVLPDDAQAYLLLELAGYAGSNTFGIYEFSDAGGVITLGDTLEVFSGGDSPTFNVTLEFDLAGGTVENLNTSTTANIDDTFGFYLDGPGGTFYTHNYLNVDGDDYALLFDTHGDLSGELFGSDVVVAFEDLLKRDGSDFDYNDMVVGVNDVAPIPEPGTMLLLGSGLAGLAAWKRRKDKDA